MDTETIEACAKRLEVYAFSLELQRHMGLPDPVTVLEQAARKLRDMVPDSEGDHRPDQNASV